MLANRKYNYRRELIDGSTEIYPLHNKNGVLYGAIQMGIHHFFEKSPGKPEESGSFAKFTHVWLLENRDLEISTDRLVTIIK